jgi:hypothetical protein
MNALPPKDLAFPPFGKDNPDSTRSDLNRIARKVATNLPNNEEKRRIELRRETTMVSHPHTAGGQRRCDHAVPQRADRTAP